MVNKNGFRVRNWLKKDKIFILVFCGFFVPRNDLLPDLYAQYKHEAQNNESDPFPKLLPSRQGQVNAVTSSQ